MFVINRNNFLLLCILFQFKNLDILEDHNLFSILGLTLITHHRFMKLNIMLKFVIISLKLILSYSSAQR